MQTVGQLDQNHPQILAHRHEQLAEILGLLAFGRGKLKVCQLGHAIDQFGDLFAKQFRDFGIGRAGIFDRVMQQGRDDGGIVKPLLGQDRRHRDRMREIGLARLSGLPFMHLPAIGIGPAQQVGVGAGVVDADERDQVFDVDHSRPAWPY